MNANLSQSFESIIAAMAARDLHFATTPTLASVALDSYRAALANPQKPATLHASAKATRNGFVPMVTIRGERGQMRGSVCADVDSECSNDLAARILAYGVAAKLANDKPWLARIA